MVCFARQAVLLLKLLTDCPKAVAPPPPPPRRFQISLIIGGVLFVNLLIVICPLYTLALILYEH